MRLAVLSDIHSNLQALEQALKELRKREVNEIAFLGDLVGYGANPNECLELIRTEATICVLGNHDQAALETSYAGNFTRPGRIAAEWTHEVLTPDNAQFLSTLSFRAERNGNVFVHASPDRPESWNYVLSLEDAQPQFEYFQTAICFIGHTHIPSICGEDLKTFEYREGTRFLINVGSVGQPRDGNPQLSFGLLDTVALTYENVRLNYDVVSAADAILKNGLPKFLADRLFKGV